MKRIVQIITKNENPKACPNPRRAPVFLLQLYFRSLSLAPQLLTPSLHKSYEQFC